MAKHSTTKKRLILLDAHAIIHRAYHALPDFSSGQTGEPTGALYGLAAMLIKIIDELKPDYIAAAYDLPGPTHRHDAFDEYKAGRQALDEALTLQINRSRDVFTAFNIPIFEKPGFEADDILGTIVSCMKEEDIDIVIASGDMDTLQLISDGVSVYTLRKGIKDTMLYDEKAVRERYGFGPELIPDFKGLRGDPSDNIPGIPGIGEKTATELIQAFGSIVDMYTALEKDEAAFSKHGIKPRMVALLKEHRDDAEFSRALAEIRRDAPIRFTLPKPSWKETFDTKNVKTLFAELGFRSLSDRISRISNNKESVVAEPEAEPSMFETIDADELNKTAIALWVLDSEQGNATADDITRAMRAKTFTDARDRVFRELEKSESHRVFIEIEEPLIPVVKKMEIHGVRLDVSYLKKLSKEYHTKLAEFEKNIYKLAGEEFNINSSQQLSHILFEKLGLSGKGRTATGRRSTRESELAKLSDAHPIIEEILQYRELAKLLSTYIDNMPHMVSPKDGRLHARFLQNGAATGRMASQQPNLQNIPIRTLLGSAVRHAFIAEDGFELVTLDYSQIELRIAAMLSHDPIMTEVFRSGGDIHAAVAEKVFGVHDKDSRRKAKVINFGIVYGMGVNALAKATGTKQAEAREFLEEYKKRFSTLIEYLEDTKTGARKRGFTETLFGRRRYFPGIESHLPYVRAEAERQAMNAPLQGTAADVIKLAMVEADQWIQKNNHTNDAHLVLQVHDELVYEIRKEKIKDIAPELKNIMEGVVPKEKTHDIPLVVEVSHGTNWGELTKLEL